MTDREDPVTAYEDEPHIENGVHHPYSAFNQGHDAFLRGYPIEMNPYSHGLNDWYAEWWDRGWKSAEDDGDLDLYDEDDGPDEEAWKDQQRKEWTPEMETGDPWIDDA